MKSLLNLVVFILSIYAYGQSVQFSDFFTQGSLRIDLIFNGSHTAKEVTIFQLKKEPYYGGGTTAQLFYPNYGNYRIQVRDYTTGQLIFSKGFSPIFEEWRATPEAKKRKRSFENTIQIPFPKKMVSVEVQARNRDGQFETMLAQAIAPEDYNIIREKPLFFNTEKIYGKKASSQAVDIAIIAEGYTATEMAKFKADAQRLAHELFSVAPFDSRKEDFNVYIVYSPSEESGTDIPGEHIYKNTILNSRFYTFDTPRYLTTLSLFKLADIAANVPYDQIFVVVNTDRYGGGGFYNVMNLVSADDALSGKVFVHEFGHGFVGLGDEYYDNSGGTEDLYNLKIEPWEPNITTRVDFKNKWEHLVSPQTPIPTPRQVQYENVVGVFEGGGYSPKGIYSPMMDCRMKSNTPDNFCPVCADAITKAIDFYTQ